MRRARGQVIAHGAGKWLLRLYVGLDPQGKRIYTSNIFRGTGKEARQELTKLVRAKDTGTLIVPSQQSLKAFAEEWLASKVRVAESTLLSYRKHLERYILPALGHLKLSEITSPVIQAAYNALRERGLAPRTIEYAHAMLYQLLKKAVRLGLLAKNPAEFTERPEKVERDFTILSPDQMLTLFESEKDKRLYPLWVLLLFTGLRPGEALALKWGDLDGDTLRVQRVLSRTGVGSYEIVEGKAKTKRSLRPVTLPPFVLDILKTHRQQQAKEMLAAGERYERSAFLFSTSLGRHLNMGNVRDRWKSALKRAGLPMNVRLYDTRHSHATALLNANTNLAWVADRLGHSSTRMTEAIYTRVLPEAHREMAESMERVLKEARTKKANSKQ